MIEDDSVVKNEKELRVVCDDVDPADRETKHIITQLKSTLESFDSGAGLAAIQIGFKKRIFVVKLSSGIKAFLNANIISYKDPYVTRSEGCLSFPGEWIKTIRFKEIEIDYQKESGERVCEWHSGFGAHVIQHEYDHQNGILMFDRKVPTSYDLCFCGSRKKFKFCCRGKL